MSRKVRFQRVRLPNDDHDAYGAPSYLRRVEDELEMPNLVAIPLNTTWTSETLEKQITLYGIPDIFPGRPALFLQPESSGFTMRNGVPVPTSLDQKYLDAGGNSWYFYIDEGTGENYWGTNQGKGFPALPNGGAYVALDHERYYDFGGLKCSGNNCDSGSYTFSNTVQVYDPIEGSFSSKPGDMDAAAGGPDMPPVALALPNFGKSGLIAVLIGDLSSVQIFDPETNTSYHQKTTGSIPSERMVFCAQATSGSSGSYEIYLYGGVSSSMSSKPDTDIYVLSLPAFTWFKKTAINSTPRIFHRCEIKGSSLISIGGQSQEINNLYYASFSEARKPDPFANGIGVLDLTNFNWTNQYSWDDAEYKYPSFVRDWYSDA
jgi:hypothetical protein